jgi:glycosyltransferase involved in cell wall biosynthesis
MQVRTIMPNTPSLGLARSYLRLCKWLVKSGVTIVESDSPADIVLAFAASNTGQIAQRASQKYDIPMVLRDDFYLYASRLGNFNELLQEASQVVVLSEGVKAKALEFEPSLEDKVTVIGNGFDSSQYDVGYTIELPLSKPVIATCGYLSASKDLDTLYNAFLVVKAAYPNATLLIIGDGLGKFKGYKDVHLEGVVNSKRVLGYLRNADIYVNSSVWEGMSNSVIEAMYCNLPVVATTPSAGLVTPIVNVKDYQALGEWLLWFLDNPDAAKDKGADNYQLVLKGHKPEDEAQSYKALFEGVIGKWKK